MKHVFFSLVFLIFSMSLCIKMVASQNTTATATATVPVKVGVVLNMDKWLGKMGLSCIKMALSDFYASHLFYKTRIVLHIRDSNSDVVRTAAAALDLIKNVEVQAIIGPATSTPAEFMIALGEKAQVPIVSFSASSPLLASTNSSYFLRATQKDSSQVNATASLIQAFGWREVVPVFADNKYGRDIIPYLSDALLAVNTRILYHSIISTSANDDQIAKELYKLMTLQTRVFIVHMFPPLAYRLFLKAKELGMMTNGYVWIVTDGITEFLSSQDNLVIEAMHGVLGVKTYIPSIKALKEFRARWKRKFHQDNPDAVDPELNIYGLYAYDVTMALAMAIEKAGTTNLSFKKADNSSSTSNADVTDLETLGVSLYGPNLLQALSKTNLRGITGDFFFIDGQLQSSTYQIVNVNGNPTRGIGLWTTTAGLVQKLNSTVNNISSYSASRSNLAPIIWPGDSTSVPKGWEIPTNGKKLRIGVPVKEGFLQFVQATIDPSTNTRNIQGYSISVFDAVVKELPYALTYEYTLFAKPNGKKAGEYDDLVYQVHLGNYDAVVGDVTITANRSLNVDFTLPYTESGVSMIVPIKDYRSKNAWVFLRPLTWDLWATSFCFFVFIGFVVWVLEHRVNEDFRGPPVHQAGTSFWFSFSTLVFTQREKVVSNLARAVIIIWCFVVLVLTQSYTASLTSLLTVQQLQPTVTDANELIKKGAYVGYLDGSFVAGILKRLGFPEDRLLVYKSVEECDELFTKGRDNHRIAAAFDEVPYMKLFLAKYCSKYTMVEPTFKTAGFGFAFPQGSPLVSDISKAILNVMEGDKMKKIEETWFGKETNCPDSTTSVSSNSLSLESFWGLFLISGSASLVALMIFTAKFVHENRHVLLSSDPNASIWSRICNLLTIFNQKDQNAYTFRKSGINDERHNMAFPSTGAPSPFSCSVHTDLHGGPSTGAPSPFSCSVRTVFPGEQGTPTAEFDPYSSRQVHQNSSTVNSEPVIQNQDRSTTVEVEMIEPDLR